jgi:hypothetical protein
MPRPLAGTNPSIVIVTVNVVRMFHSVLRFQLTICAWELLIFCDTVSDSGGNSTQVYFTSLLALDDWDGKKLFIYSSIEV